MDEPTDEQPEECNSCSYETTELRRYECGHSGGRPAWLCELCAGTLAGNEVDGSTADGPVLKTICYVGNVILDAIRGIKDG